jgi:hypothetical protein
MEQNVQPPYLERCVGSKDDETPRELFRARRDRANIVLASLEIARLDPEPSSLIKRACLNPSHG